MDSGRIRLAVFGVAGAVLISKLLGFLREMVIADKFGTSADYDIYLLGSMIPALMGGVLSYASFYLLVPYLTRKLEQDRASDLTAVGQSIWSALNLNLLVSLGATVATLLVGPYIMEFWLTDFSPADTALAVFFCRVTAAMIFLATVEAVQRAYLNACRVFIYPAAGPILFNFVSISCIILLQERWSVGAIAAGLLIGMSLQNLYLLFRILSRRLMPKFCKVSLVEETKMLVTTGSMLIAIEFLNRSYFLIDRYFAPVFGDGVISALNYGQVLIQLPDAVAGLAIGAVIFPAMSMNQGRDMQENFANLYVRAISAALIFAVPMALFFLFNASDMVYLIFHRGAFDQHSVALTATVLVPYTPSIIALFVISSSVRACYAMGWMKPVLMFAIMLLCIKFLATALLPLWFGFAGISAATTVAHVAFAVALAGLVISRIDAVYRRRFLWVVLRLLLAGIIVGLIMWIGSPWLALSDRPVSLVNKLYTMAVSGLLIVILFLVTASMLGLWPVISSNIPGLGKRKP